MAHDLKKELLFFPNLLTFLRILLIPAVLIYIDNESPLRCFIAALFYSISAITDFIDGYVARRFGQVSLLGKLLDPLADKILVMATLVWMVPLGRIDAWLVIVLLARELSITGLRSVASSEGLVISARQMGKHKTALQLVGILCLILYFRCPILFTNLVVDLHQVGVFVLYISLVFSIFSAVEYVHLFAKAVQQKGEREKEDDDQRAQPKELQ